MRLICSTTVLYYASNTCVSEWQSGRERHEIIDIVRVAGHIGNAETPYPSGIYEERGESVIAPQQQPHSE